MCPDVGSTWQASAILLCSFLSLMYLTSCIYRKVFNSIAVNVGRKKTYLISFSLRRQPKSIRPLPYLSFLVAVQEYNLFSVIYTHACSRRSSPPNIYVSAVHNVVYIHIMFHAIWEFARSADRVTQYEDLQIGSHSADCYAICRW